MHVRQAYAAGSCDAKDSKRLSQVPGKPACPESSHDAIPSPLKLFADLNVMVDKPQEVGRAARGLRRLIPILGGEAIGNGPGGHACCPAERTFSSW